MIKTGFLKTILGLSIMLLTACSINKPMQLSTESADNWYISGDADWNFSSDKATGTITEGTSFIMTKEQYSDFELTLDFYPDSEVNSGIFIRCQNQEINPTDCYEVNIWDNHPNQQNRTGAIVAKMPPMQIVNSVGKWNTYKIASKGNRTRVWLNGTMTADYKDDQLKTGYIGLQVAIKGTIQFRNIQISEYR